MATPEQKPLTPPPPPLRPGGKSRRHDIDNLRSFCTAHVIAHHTAIAYGGIDGALPPQAHSGLFDHASPLFTPFIATNLSYGMGLYFWLSGKMTAQSMSRASTSDVGLLRNKLWRIGLPAVLYSAFIDPVQVVLSSPQPTLAGNLRTYLNAIKSLDGVKGPVWYNATLIVFDICAVVLKHVLAGRVDAGSPTAVKIYHLVSRFGWLGVAAASFLLRTKYPPGKFIPVIGVQPAYLLQYIYGYALGHAAFHMGEMSIPGPKMSVYKAYAISLGTLPLLFLPGFLTGDGLTNLQLGGWNWTAALYAFWNELSFFTLAPAVMQAFERNYNRPAGKGLWSPRYSYAAFLLHPLVSWVADIGLAMVLKRAGGGKLPAWMSLSAWQAFGPLVVTAAMSAVDILGSFKLGQVLIDYVPGVGSLL